MTLQRPELLLLGPTVALLLSLALGVQWRRRGRLGAAYGRVGAPRLLPARLQRFPSGRMLCLILASLALGAAMAGPTPATREPAEPPPPLDIAVAVDVSLSMGAADVAPSRIERARDVVDRLSESLASARIVLVLFADWPYTLVPPTDDPTVVRYFARSLSTDLVSGRDQGTSFATAIVHAREALEARPRVDARQAVLLLSDGGAQENAARVVDAAADAAGRGVPVWVAGVGTIEGAAVTGPAGPVVDEAGRAVTARLDAPLLREVARAGNGEYHDVSDDRGLRELLEALGGLGADTSNAEGGTPDATFWLVLLTVPVLLIEGGLDAGRRLRRRRPSSGS